MNIKEDSLDKLNQYRPLNTVNIIISILIICISLFTYISSLSFNIILLIYGWLGNLILIWGVSVFKRIKGTHINPYTFFFLSYFFFSYGQIFLNSIGHTYDRYNLLEIFEKQEIVDYSLYFSLGTVFFLMGAFAAIRKESYLDEIVMSKRIQKRSSLNKSIKIVIWPLFAISAPIYLSNIIDSLLKSLQFGYGAIYEIRDSSSLLNIAGSTTMWFIPSIFILLVLYKKNIFLKTFFLFTLIFVFLISMIIGGRSTGIALVASLLFLWDSEISKITRKQKSILIVLIIFIFVSLPVIANFRGSVEKNIYQFIEIWVDTLTNENPLVNIIGELGGSMQPWLLTNRLVPAFYNFKLGQSYIASFLAVIPSLFMGGYSFTQYAQLSGWLQNAAEMSYGPGFSILAEAFYNFGWFGIPLLFLKGWFFFKILSNYFLKNDMIIYRNLFSAITLFLFITSARGSMYLMVRSEVYVIVLPILLVNLVDNSLMKRK